VLLCFTDSHVATDIQDFVLRLSTSGSVRFSEFTLTMDAQYDVAAEEVRKVAARRELRARMKDYYQKERGHPYKQGGGGYLFDPAVQRFMSARATKYDFFKPTGRGFFNYFASVWLPIFGFAYYLRWYRGRKEQKLRSGQVAYKDRDFKYV